MSTDHDGSGSWRAEEPDDDETPADADLDPYDDEDEDEDPDEEDDEWALREQDRRAERQAGDSRVNVRPRGSTGCGSPEGRKLPLETWASERETL